MNQRTALGIELGLVGEMPVEAAVGKVAPSMISPIETSAKPLLLNSRRALSRILWRGCRACAGPYRAWPPPAAKMMVEHLLPHHTLVRKLSKEDPLLDFYGTVSAAALMIFVITTLLVFLDVPRAAKLVLAAPSAFGSGSLPPRQRPGCSQSRGPFR
jgi:hypothetical protein